jgi:hypothetical protein
MGPMTLNHKDIVRMIIMREGVLCWIAQPSQLAGNKIIGKL